MLTSPDRWWWWTGGGGGGGGGCSLGTLTVVIHVTVDLVDQNLYLLESICQISSK